MTAALLLCAYALLIARTAPALLRTADRAPRLAVAAWYAAVATVGSSLVAAVALLVATPEHSWERLCALVRLCVEALRGAHDWIGVLLAAFALAGAAIVAFRIGVAAVGTLGASMRGRHRQARLVDAAGRRLPGTDATVVDHDVATAYLVPGRHPTIVVTSAAVAALTGRELAAVIAHEQGHRSGRHHLLVDGMRVLNRAFPRSRFLAVAHAQVALLVEICADEAAARRHSRIDLARALVTMAEAQASPAVLAASGGDALTRIKRLLSPPDPLGRGTRAGLTAVLATMASAPVVVAALALAWPLLMDCPAPFV